MPILWTPAPGLWFDRIETEQNVVEQILADGGQSEILSFSVSPANLPAQVSIIFSGGTLTLSAPNLIGLFPITSIKYVSSAGTAEVFDFDDLPLDGIDIVDYRKDPSAFIVYSIEVQAQSIGGQETATFEFVIRADYSPGRDRLVGEINARS